MTVELPQLRFEIEQLWRKYQDDNPGTQLDATRFASQLATNTVAQLVDLLKPNDQYDDSDIITESTSAIIHPNSGTTTTLLDQQKITSQVLKIHSLNDQATMRRLAAEQAIIPLTDSKETLQAFTKSLIAFVVSNNPKTPERVLDSIRNDLDIIAKRISLNIKNLENRAATLKTLSSSLLRKDSSLRLIVNAHASSFGLTPPEGDGIPDNRYSGDVTENVL